MTIPEIYTIFDQHPYISTDSRNCPAGCMFFALKGDNFNANSFAASALENGAAFAVIDEPSFAVDQRFIVVENVLSCLQQLATYHRKQIGTTIIGITGTNGKTTSKELIAAVLQQKFNVHFTKGNLNNHIGVPLTLLQLTKNHEMAVVEMGANHPGEIKELSELARPDYGIITNVGKAHLEGFGSFEGVKKTKAELYQFVRDHAKMIFINADNEHLNEMANKAGFTNGNQQFKYSLLNETNADVHATVVSCSPFLSMKCIDKAKGNFDINTQLVGIYNAENVLAAITIGQYFGVSNEEIKRGLESYMPQNNRSQLTITDRNKLVVDAYNANPTSMRAAVNNFAQMEVEHKMLILGDMLELGEQSEIEHQTIVDLLKQYQLNNVILVGDQFAKSNHNFVSYLNVDAYINSIDLKEINGYFILIKGSRGIRLEKVIPLL